jgi:glycosyltransferase involved in cell wall biosynthesis
MHVAFLSSGLETGGAELALLRLTAALRAHAVTSSVVSLRGPGAVGALFRQAAIDVLPLGLPAPASVVAALPRLSEFLRRRSASLVHGWMYHGNLAAYLAGRRLHLPVVWGIRQSLAGAQDPWLTRRVISVGARLSRTVDAIVYNSAGARVQHEARGYAAPKSAVIPNGFDTDRLQPNAELRNAVRAQLGITADAPVVIQVARFHADKDYPNLLRAAAQVAADVPGVTFLLVGQGVDATNAGLARLVNDLDMQRCVRMLGRRDDVARLFAAADVSVLGSVSESFPNVIGEAMCCGVPCVATAVGDVPQLIGDTGVVVPPNDSRALAAGIVHILSLDASARHALGAKARERIVQNYSIGEVARRYAEFLFSVSHGHR